MLGIEFACTAIKVVKMAVLGDRSKLLYVRSVPIPLPDPSVDEGAALKKALSEAIASEDLGNALCLLSVNSPQACFDKFIIPKLPEKELLDILGYKMGDVLPFSTKEALFEHRLFEIPGTGKESRYSVLVTAVPKIDSALWLQRLSQTVQGSFVPVHSVYSLESFPVTAELKDRHLVAVVDIGHAMTEINLYQNGKLSFVRKVNMGGQSFLQALTQPLSSEKGRVSLTEDEALKLLKELDLLNPETSEWAADKIESSKLYPLIRPELEKLASELQRSFDYYTQEHGEGIERVFLTGGMGNLKNLDRFLEQEIGVPTKVFEFEKEIEMVEALQSTSLGPFYRLIAVLQEHRNMRLPILQTFEKSIKREVKGISYQQVAVVSVCAFVVICLGLFWMMVSTQAKIDRLHSQIRNLEPGFQYSQKVAAIESQVSDADLIAQKLLESTPAWSQVFRELSHVVLDNTILTEISFDQGVILLKGKSFGEEGEAALSKLLLSLEGTVFREVSLVQVERNEEEGAAFFTIRCEVH